jgi:LmbE family N-acetylglucosaminyl deacetylase
VAASAVLRTAAFTSALRRFVTDADPWRPDWVCYYFINDSGPASFVVDVSDHYQRKRDALDCYRSQFTLDGARAFQASEGESIATRLNAPTFRQLIESRDAQFGALAGVAFAEGIVVREPVLRPGLLRSVP